MNYDCYFDYVILDSAGISHITNFQDGAGVGLVKGYHYQHPECAVKKIINQRTTKRFNFLQKVIDVYYI